MLTFSSKNTVCLYDVLQCHETTLEHSCFDAFGVCLFLLSFSDSQCRTAGRADGLHTMAACLCIRICSYQWSRDLNCVYNNCNSVCATVLSRIVNCTFLPFWLHISEFSLHNLGITARYFSAIIQLQVTATRQLNC